MNKTIEEAAREASVAYCSKYADSAQPYEVAYTEFMHGANHIMALPLRDRLTEAEKEMVRKEYANTHPNDIDCGVENMLIQGVLERIFGADFFKEGE